MDSDPLLSSARPSSGGGEGFGSTRRRGEMSLPGSLEGVSGGGRTLVWWRRRQLLKVSPTRMEMHGARGDLFVAGEHNEPHVGG